ncbi:N-acetylmuramoyl-L-alanine amidase [Oceanobacillus limi]|uniref:N-acetylmuramoyl-L-alanine amidase n=1 Tax=Oceanobacillus limi TaxID=930131 RepID=A0A1I0AEW7_9BACI|nr:N-acetylmuramoyl-L-alanine amidase [Oceanobacillus limi]SES92826.1 N-acetylmuramoyl-L-alanine amidase [Oceanobacillus limi]
MKKLFHRILVTGVLFSIFFFGPTLIANAEEDGQLYEVDTEQLNMRTGPTHEAKIIGQLEEGDRLRIFDEQDGWVKTFYSGEPVWVSANYLIFIEEEKKEEIEDKQTESEQEEMEKANETENEEDYTQDYYTFSDSMENHPIYMPPSDEQSKTNVKTLEQRDEKVSGNAIEITDDLLDGKQIVIDPGHGGKDNGAKVGKIIEKKLTLSTAQKVMNHLENAGAEVHLTRSDDEFVSLNNRVSLSHSKDADAFISLHYDYFKDKNVHGVNTYYYNDQTSLELSKTIHASLVQHVNMHDRGIRKAGFLVLRKNNNPSILLELGFMTNPDNLATIQTDNYQNQVAQALTDGLIKYFE